MNATSSGVAISAAKMRSPSFSRSASSTTTTGLPAAMSATALRWRRKRSSAQSFGPCGQQPLPVVSEPSLDVLGQHVDLDIDVVTDLAASSVVRRNVSGIRLTDSRSPSTAVTVRLTPSTAIEPFSTTVTR